MEIEQESERPVNINCDDVEKCLAYLPSSEELDEFGKHELGLLASYYQLYLPMGSNRQSLRNVLREELYGTLNPDSGGDQGRNGIKSHTFPHF